MMRTHEIYINIKWDLKRQIDVRSTQLLVWYVIQHHNVGYLTRNIANMAVGILDVIAFWNNFYI